jgi:phosphoglycerol transferase MdoB-like AlkP superfamily enzyme
LKQGRVQCWLELVCCVLLLSLVFTIAAEVVYSQNQGWESLALSLDDKRVLIGLLVSQPLLLMVPVLALSGVLLMLGHNRWARGVTWGASGVVFTWFGVNLFALMVTGNQVHTYFQYFGDSDALEMGGGGALVSTLLLLLAVLSVLIAGVIWLSRAVVSRCYPSRFPAVGGTAAGVLTGLLLCLLVVPINLAASSERPLLVVRLLDALPVPLPFVSIQERLAADPSVVLREINGGLEVLVSEYGPKLAAAPPIRSEIELPDNQNTNVIVIVLESLRHDAFESRWMPEVAAWAKTGLQLRNHYANTNTSHLGFFALLYGRSPLVYHSTIDAGQPSALAATLRQAGYRSTFLAGTNMDWQRMDEYLSDVNFDEQIIDQQGEWFDRDRRTLARVEEIASRSTSQFVAVHMNSTHFPYMYPAEFERFRPVASAERPGSSAAAAVARRRLLDEGEGTDAFRQSWLNRYRNTLSFLDSSLAQLLNDLDPARNIVILTGDHGESFYEDGTWMHSSRQSDIQTQVPMIMTGPGISPDERNERTSHLDVVPTLLHALGASSESTQGWSGHDVLDDEAALDSDSEDDLLIVNFSTDHLVVLFGDQRLHLKFDKDPEAMYSLGFEDPTGRFLPLAEKLSEPSHLWVEAIRRQLEKATR